MGKVLILLNAAGLILNLLVFLIVVHYFGNAGVAAPETAAPADAVTRSELEQQAASIRKAIQDLPTRLRMPRNLDQLPADLGRIKSDVNAMKLVLGKLSALVEDVPEPVPPVEAASSAPVVEPPPAAGAEGTTTSEGTENVGTENDGTEKDGTEGGGTGTDGNGNQ
jgi:hypothetical protein